MESDYQGGLDGLYLANNADRNAILVHAIREDERSTRGSS